MKICSICDQEKNIPKGTICAACEKRKRRPRLSATQANRVAPDLPVTLNEAARHQIPPFNILHTDDSSADIKPDRPPVKLPHENYLRTSQVDTYPDGGIMSAPDAHWWRRNSKMGADWCDWLPEVKTRKCDPTSGCGKPFNTRLRYLRWCEKCQ